MWDPAQERVVSKLFERREADRARARLSSGPTDQKDPTPVDIITILSPLIVAGVFALVGWGTPLLDWAYNVFLTPIALVISGLVASFVLFLLRNIRQDIYGLLEIAVAAFVLGSISSEVSKSDSLSLATAFLGGVYISVRGLTNYKDGRDKRRPARKRVKTSANGFDEAAFVDASG